MAYLSQPSFRKFLLGHSLTTLREAAGLEILGAAQALKVSHSKIRRHESGATKVSYSDLGAYLTLYQVTEPSLVERLERLREIGAKRGDHVPEDVATTLKNLMEAEALADRVTTWQPLVIPGLLQSSDYMRDLLETGSHGVGPQVTEERIALRENRQKRLQGDSPLKVWAVIGEGALRNEVCKRAVLQDQLRYLLELGELAHVVVQVLPFSGGRFGSAPPFMAIDFPVELGLQPVAYSEGLYEIFVTDRSEVARLNTYMNHLRSQAASQQDSRELIHKIVREL